MDGQNMYHVQVGDIIKEYPEGTPYFKIAEDFQEGYANDIVLLNNATASSVWTVLLPMGISCSAISRMRLSTPPSPGRLCERHCSCICER